MQEKDIEVYSTMSKTRAAFEEKAFQSLKHITYPFMEVHGEHPFTSYLNLRLQVIVALIDILRNHH